MNPFEVLGVSKNADEEEIKKAYKRKAMKCHPDKGGDPEEFKSLNEAYSKITNNHNSSEVPNDMHNFFAHMFHQHFFKRNIEMRITLEDIYKNKEINVNGTKLYVAAGTPLFSAIQINEQMSLILKPKNHNVFTLDSSGNLIIKEEISLYEALTGFRKRIQHPDGTMYYIEEKSVIQNGHSKVGFKKGIPVGSNGHITNFICEFKVMMPKSIDSKYTETLKEMLNYDLQQISKKNTDVIL